MSKKPAGSFVALITPFNKDGSVDFAAFHTLLKFQDEQGPSAVLIMGSTRKLVHLAQLGPGNSRRSATTFRCFGIL